MLSSALAGVLRVGAVVLTAGGLGSGVYFLLPAGEGEDGVSRLQAPEAVATAEGPGPLSPPEEVIVPPPPPPTPAFPPPTPAFPPPITPSPIDTSAWRTYDSPEGFSLKYPPDWLVRTEEGTALDVSFLNPATVRAFDEAMERGDIHVPRVAGMTELRVILPNSARFDPGSVVQTCESPDALTGGPPGRARLVTFAGRAAVFCEGLHRVGSGEDTLAVGYSVEFPPGHTSIVAWRTTPPTSSDLSTIAAIVSSFSFQTPQ